MSTPKGARQSGQNARPSQQRQDQTRSEQFDGSGLGARADAHRDPSGGERPAQRSDHPANNRGGPARQGH